MAEASIEVVLYSKPGCCLCDEVKAQIRSLARVHHFEWREVNILNDSELHARFAERIPVVFINGHHAFDYALDEKEFVKRLASAASAKAAAR